MKAKSLNILTLFLFLNSLPGHTKTPLHLSYEVRKNDTLSEILGWLGICPIWGKGSLIKKTAIINKETIKKNGHLIVPKKRILLPTFDLPQHEDYSISQDGLVTMRTTTPIYKCGLTKAMALPQRQIASQKESPLIKEDVVTDPEVIVVPTSEPSHEVNAPQIDDDESHGVLRIERDFYFSSLDLKDKLTGDTAQLLSRINNTSKIYWDQAWDDENKTFLFYKSGNQDYEPYENKFQGKKLGLLGFGMGYEKKLSQDFSLVLIGQVEEKPFLRALTVSSIILERAMIPSLELRPKLRLVSRKKLSLDAEGALSYLLPGETSNYKIESGFRMGAGLSVVQKIKDFEIKGMGFYNVENQNSKIMEKKMKELGISFGVSWSFGK